MEKSCKVSFRLSGGHGTKLRLQAEALNMSPHQLARLALVREMEGSIELQLKQQLMALRAEVGLLRQDLLRALEQQG